MKYKIDILLLVISCLFCGCSTPRIDDRWYDSAINNDVRCTVDATIEGTLSDKDWESLVLHLKHLKGIKNPVVIQQVLCFDDPCIAVRIDMEPVKRSEYYDEMTHFSTYTDTVKCVRLPDGRWITRSTSAKVENGCYGSID